MDQFVRTVFGYLNGPMGIVFLGVMLVVSVILVRGDKVYR
ncbi:hypothetical protein Pan216_36400 [Planctomycetes bacterium Pan216]|uniref:Uncharacterized protein n=1 Tax=Kolteria novifilia TaxID=2527975 RepID=A0A518B716_9BACT|nr:hypothetical protein Pan216_36400 [Planctomycetes bacterium Pan216]